MEIFHNGARDIAGNYGCGIMRFHPSIFIIFTRYYKGFHFYLVLHNVTKLFNFLDRQIKFSQGYFI